MKTRSMSTRSKGIALSALAAFGLSGCFGNLSIDNIETVAEQYGEDKIAADAMLLRFARWKECEGATVGAIMLEFRSPDERAAWEVGCEAYYRAKQGGLELPALNPYE